MSPEVRLECLVLAPMTPQQDTARVLGQNRAAVKGVDDQPLAADQEMPGEVDALDIEPGPARDLHVDDSQRDRNAGAAIEHLVQEAVTGIAVVAAVAGELQLLEQEAIERLYSERTIDRGDPQEGFAAEHVELVQ